MQGTGFVGETRRYSVRFGKAVGKSPKLSGIKDKPLFIPDSQKSPTRLNTEWGSLTLNSPYATFMVLIVPTLCVGTINAKKPHPVQHRMGLDDAELALRDVHGLDRSHALRGNAAPDAPRPL